MTDDQQEQTPGGQHDPPSKRANPSQLMVVASVAFTQTLPSGAAAT